MQCPLDGSLLVRGGGQDVRFDTCPMCGGVWIDSSEFERPATRRRQR
jgi:Zn-finger nucleic acid-binding protein